MHLHFFRTGTIVPSRKDSCEFLMQAMSAQLVNNGGPRANHPYCGGPRTVAVASRKFETQMFFSRKCSSESVQVRCVSESMLNRLNPLHGDVCVYLSDIGVGIESCILGFTSSSSHINVKP